jgi:hypothetical protein
MCLALRLTCEPMVTAPTERNMKVVVDQFAENLETNATNPPAPAGLPLHYLAKVWQSFLRWRDKNSTTIVRSRRRR